MGLDYEKEGHIARVGLNRPKERNALDPQILMDLHQAWKEINGDDAIRVVILTPCRAMEILLTAGNFKAQTLCEWGFLNRVVPVGGLMTAAMEMAEKIAGNGPLAIQGIIRCFRESREMGYTDAFRKEMEIGLPVFSSADAREGICAQKEKRRPNFPGTYN